MGIVVNARNSGVGTWAMEQLIEEAKARGEKQMLLEVIEQNTAGVKLYEKVGFEKVRRLVGYKIENPQVEVDINSKRWTSTNWRGLSPVTVYPTCPGS